MSRFSNYDVVSDYPTFKESLKDEGYNLVYQGGHHNVYCNDEKHVRTYGGTTRMTDENRPFLNPITKEIDTFKCNCGKYDR